MKIEQIYTGCLAQGAYYITSKGEAAIIDPLREINPYLERAKNDGVKIKYIFETHFHADFVSGHVDLANKTGASIIYGPTAQPEFDAIIATDGQVFNIGDLSITVLHTPGHTMESSCYLLKDTYEKDYCIFTGDTLFLGDVGRPDLAQKATNMTQDQLAGLLYDSLMTKIMPLSDDLIVYPAHGAGSACGKNMMKETVDNLGHQKQTNYALNQPDKVSFIKAVTEGLSAPPAYFPMNVAMNKQGYESIDNVISNGMRALSPTEFDYIIETTDTLVLDTRNANDFYKALVPYSVNIGLNGDFAPWVGALIKDVKQPIILVTAPGKEEETVIRLSRVGFDNIIGHLANGINSWIAEYRPTDSIERISAAQFIKLVPSDEDIIIDIRKESEFTSKHVKEAINKPLDKINEWIGGIDKRKHFFLHCAAGYRSMIASSILKGRGFHNFTEIEGGFTSLLTEGVPTADGVLEST